MVALQLLAVHWPSAQRFFHITPLSAENWGIATLAASSVLLLEELRKALHRRAERTRRPHRRP